MNNSGRKHHAPEEKVSILRRYLIEKIPVSNLCEKFGLHPTVFYRWLKQFFENGAAALQNHRPDSGRRRDQERVAVDAATIASLRAQGRSWATISAELGVGKGTAQRACASLPKNPSQTVLATA